MFEKLDHTQVLQGLHGAQGLEFPDCLTHPVLRDKPLPKSAYSNRTLNLDRSIILKVTRPDIQVRSPSLQGLLLPPNTH